MEGVGLSERGNETESRAERKTVMRGIGDGGEERGNGSVFNGNVTAPHTPYIPLF